MYDFISVTKARRSDQSLMFLFFLKNKIKKNIFFFKFYVFIQLLLLLLLLLLLKTIGNARPGDGDFHSVSPKTPAQHYQPIEEKKRKGK